MNRTSCFLFDQGYEGGADDESAEDFATVQKLVDRFAKLRKVPRFAPRQETAAPGPYSDEERDREVITELMKGLRDPDITPRRIRNPGPYCPCTGGTSYDALGSPGRRVPW
ncbi:hypothetical protein ABZV80_38925 [Streptomyces sp. NPDC005132]|uniref:hypothetical protein n=1 Tax=Streptomyces sp. NPDC005132 TaxID=3154294 RepID=UPI0033AB12E5